MLPIYRICLTSICSRFFLDSSLEAKNKSKLLKTFFANLGKIFHLFKVFFVILALIKINVIFFSLILNKKFGHISESIKQIKFGCHFSRKEFTKNSISIGKKRCV